MLNLLRDVESSSEAPFIIDTLTERSLQNKYLLLEVNVYKKMNQVVPRMHKSASLSGTNKKNR